MLLTLVEDNRKADIQTNPPHGVDVRYAAVRSKVAFSVRRVHEKFASILIKQSNCFHIFQVTCLIYYLQSYCSLIIAS